MVDYSGLEELFDPKHESWKQLYSAHSKAHKTALGKVKNDTTGLDEEEVFDQVAKFMHSYDHATGVAPPWDELKEYQQEIFSAKARTLIEDIAKKEEVTLEDKIRQLQREGLESVFNLYHSSQKGNDAANYGKSITDKHVKKDDWEEWKDILKEKNPMLIKGVDDGTLSSEIGQYMRTHLIQYHGKTKPKEK